VEPFRWVAPAFLVIPYTPPYDLIWGHQIIFSWDTPHGGVSQFLGHPEYPFPFGPGRFHPNPRGEFNPVKNLAKLLGGVPPAGALEKWVIGAQKPRVARLGRNLVQFPAKVKIPKSLEVPPILSGKKNVCETQITWGPS